MAITVATLAAKVTVEGADKAKSDLKDVGEHAKETESSFKKMKEQIARGFEFGTGMQLAQIPGTIFDAAKEQFVDIIKLAMDHQQIMSQTNQVLRSTRDVSKMSADSLDELAQKFGKTTQFSADTVQSGENLLLTFTNIGHQVFPQATQAILDVSQAMGQDLKESAIQVGKALGDPLTGMTALQRIGVTFSESEKEQIKTMMKHNDIVGAQKVILHELSTEFGGSAQAAGKTFAGQLKIAQDRIEELKIKIGTALMPILQEFLQYFEQHILPRLEDFSTWFQTKGIPRLQDFSTWFQQTGIPALQDFGGKVGDIVGKLTDFVGWLQKGGPAADTVKVALTGIGTVIAGIKVAGFIKDLNDGLGNIITKAGDMKQSFSDFISWFGDTFLGKFKGTAKDAASAEEGIGTTMKTTVASDVAEGSAKAELAEAGIGAEAVKAEGTVATASAEMKASLGGVIGLYGVLLAGVPLVAQKVHDQAGPLEQQIRELQARGEPIPPYLRQAAHDAGVPGYASGVLSAPGGWSLVGEHGPELVNLPRGSQVLPNSMLSGGSSSGSAGQTIILQIDGVQFARVAMPYLTNQMRYAVGSVGW